MSQYLDAFSSSFFFDHFFFWYGDLLFSRRTRAKTSLSLASQAKESFAGENLHPDGPVRKNSRRSHVLCRTHPLCRTNLKHKGRKIGRKVSLLVETNQEIDVPRRELRKKKREP
jgi:hypothetical protein